MTTGGQYLGQEFGGEWTRLKLDILREYLNAYTTALKKLFSLVYIDAFAGNGEVSIQTSDPQLRETIDGSAKIAIDITDKQFDRIVLVEQNAGNCEALNLLKAQTLGRDIWVENKDSNSYLQELLKNTASWSGWRGTVFLDPYGTQVDWATIEAIAQSRFLDAWILLPVSATARMLPNERTPDQVSPSWAAHLTRMLGDEDWRSVYVAQGNFFGEDAAMRPSGIRAVSGLYRDRLRRLFGSRYLDETMTLGNSRNSPMFEFVFCVGSPTERAIALAKKIARDVLRAKGAEYGRLI